MKQIPLRIAVALVLLAGSLFGCSATGQKQQQPSERQKTAMAMFQERCKKAGEKIYKTVENVEGIYLLRLRPNDVNYGDQFKLDDPYGLDLIGVGYIGSFVRGHYEASHKEVPIAGAPPRLSGYLYVEAEDPNDGLRYRYTGRVEEPWQTNKAFLQGYARFVLDKTIAAGLAPRYGVTYDDISTREEREYWIAGSSLKVIDLQTKEVIAERIGYMVDWAQGSQVGGRSPWLLAANTACPGFVRNPNPLPGPASAATPYQAARFVEKVLSPSR